jgi:hypothetical protein
MNPVYKGLAKVLWFFAKLVGHVVIFAVKLVAPKVAHRLQRRLSDVGRRLSAARRGREPALADR